MIEIKTVFLDFWIFSIAHGELMIETVLLQLWTLLVTRMDAMKMLSGMLWQTKDTQLTLFGGLCLGQEKRLNKDVFSFLLNESSRLLLTYELVFAFSAIMASIEECVFQPNNVQFAFSNPSLVNVASALRPKNLVSALWVLSSAS